MTTQRPIARRTMPPRLLRHALAVALASGLALPATAVFAGEAHRTPWIVTFEEPGLLHYAGEVAGLAATRPAARGQPLDVSAAPVRAYRSHLAQQRTRHVREMEAALGRTLLPSHSYAVIRNGVALDLTEDEADTLAHMPGVASVVASEDQRLTTYRGPSFIGADTLWDGSALPGGVGTRGEGQVIGIIDSGSFAAHPSFANDPSCGFNSAAPKLLSAVDCLVASDGVCIGPDPEANPGNGHGVHVAATAAGNVLDPFTAMPPPVVPTPFSNIAGVAPCAQVRSYKVCATNMCSNAAMEAALEHALLDGVDVINLSISGGTQPWGDYDRSLLEAVGQDVFVAVAAGNTQGESNPVGQVNHLGPWLTTVAAVTHDRNTFGTGTLDVIGEAVPLQGIVAYPSSSPDLGADLADAVVVFADENADGCAPFAPGRFDGGFALMVRGACTFGTKLANAGAAGADAAIVFNNEGGAFTMDVGNETLPGYSITLDDGQRLRAHIAATAPAPVQLRLTPATHRGDVLAGFSLRGPTPPSLDLLKPDLGAPGVSIYAATDAASGHYQRLDGTSMAAPHVAGAGALLRALHPDWSPADIQSALQTTAQRDGWREDGLQPWQFDDVGSGRVALDRAARAGLTLHEDYAAFVAADPDNGGEPATLNLASIRDLRCDVSCTYTRSVTNRLAGEATWDVGYVPVSGAIDVEIEPLQFTLAPGATQDIRVRFTPPPGVAMAVAATGELRLQPADDVAPDQFIAVAIRGEGSTNYLRAATTQADVIDSCNVASVISNGIAEPGERVRLQLPVTAHGEAFGQVEARLLPPYPAGLSVQRGVDVLGQVEPGMPRSASFELTLARATVCLQDLAVRGELHAGNTRYPFEVALPVGRERPLPEGLPRNVPDADAVTGVTSVLHVTQPVALDGLAVRVAIEHPWVGDLRVVLTSPAGTSVTLLDRPGHPASAFGCGNADLAVRFVDGAASAEAICAGTGNLWPVAAAAPAGSLAAFAGESAVGDWTLQVTDATSGYRGRLLSWSLEPQPDFDPVCSVCSDPDGRIFADDFDSAATPLR